MIFYKIKTNKLKIKTIQIKYKKSIYKAQLLPIALTFLLSFSYLSKIYIIFKK